MDGLESEASTIQFPKPNCLSLLCPFFPGCLYVSGGAILEDGDGIELVQKFDTKTGHWTETTGMLIPRSGSAACFLNGFIYVIGNNDPPF